MTQSADAPRRNLPAQLGFILVVLIEIGLVLVCVFLVAMLAATPGNASARETGLLVLGIGAALLPGILLIRAFGRLKQHARQATAPTAGERFWSLALALACLGIAGWLLSHLSFQDPVELVAAVAALAPPLLLFTALGVARSRVVTY